MSAAEFSYIAGVGPLTIRNWENKSAELTLKKDPMNH